MPMPEVSEKIYRRMRYRLGGRDLEAARKMESRLITLIGGLRLNVLYPDPPNVYTRNIAFHVSHKGEAWLYYTVIGTDGVAIQTQAWVGFV